MFAATTLEAHRDEEEHHAGEGEAAGVAQVSCEAGSDNKRMSQLSHWLTAPQQRERQENSDRRCGGAKVVWC